MIEKSSGSFWYDTYVNILFVSAESHEPIAVFTEDINLPIPDQGEEVQINHRDAREEEKGEFEPETIGDYVVIEIEYAYNLTTMDVPDDIREEVDDEIESDTVQQTVVNVVIRVDPLDEQSGD